MNVQRRFVTDGEVPGYDDDFALWCDRQAILLQRGDAVGLDWENLAEEIQDMGNNLRREIESRISTILLHMMKLHMGVLDAPRAGWRETIVEQRDRTDRLLEDAPSLRKHVEGRFGTVYEKAVKKALRSMIAYEPANEHRYRRAAQDLPAWTLDQVLDEDFFPEPPQED